MISYQVKKGKEIIPYIDEIARLRIEVFREFPYLYDGNIDYEKKYLAKFGAIDESIVILALENHKVIGALTGLPIKNESKEITQTLTTNQLENGFYLSEILLYKNYRQQGIGQALMNQLETFVNKSFPLFLLATIIREENHPLKPKDYTSLAHFWIKNNYVLTNQTFSFSWKDVHNETETRKSLALWQKEI